MVDEVDGKPGCLTACWLLWACHRQAQQGLFCRLGFRRSRRPHFVRVQDARVCLDRRCAWDSNFGRSLSTRMAMRHVFLYFWRTWDLSRKHRQPGRESFDTDKTSTLAALAVDNVSITKAPTAFLKTDVSSDSVNGAAATATLRQDGFWRCRGVSTFESPNPSKR